MKERVVVGLMVISAALSVAFGAVAFADDGTYGLQTALNRSQLPTTIAGESSLPGIAGKVVQYGLSLIGILFFLLLLYAGFLWMSAMGNTEKVDSAKKILEAAIIGIVLVLGAYAITSFVFSALSGESTTSSSGSSLTCSQKYSQGQTDGQCIDENLCTGQDAQGKNLIQDNSPGLCAAPGGIVCCHN